MSKFADLIKDSYKLAKANHTIVGMVYTTFSTLSFYDLNEDKINDFVNDIHVDMLYLHSKLNDAEVQIYEYELNNYKVSDDEGILYVTTNNKEYQIKYK